MWQIIVLIIGFVVGFLIGRRVGYKKAFRYLNPDQMKEREENLHKIMLYLSAHDEITNDTVEELLHVSNATAERYLNDLEDRGRVVQVGKTGRSVKYKMK